MVAPVVLPGALSVRCPVCRAQEGRPCTNRRGYLIATHALRLNRWLAEERATQA
jgi:hypothetical protein